MAIRYEFITYHTNYTLRTIHYHTIRTKRTARDPEQAEKLPFRYKNSSNLITMKKMVYKLAIKRTEMGGMLLDSGRLHIAVRFVRIPLRDGIL